MIGSEAERVRDHFLAWQCRIRQIAMRRDGGRPSPGMRPRVLAPSGHELASALTVLIVPEEPGESTAFFRFQVQKSNDPRLIYERGLAYLQAAYFQQPATFSERMTACLPSESPLVRILLGEGACLLEFSQYRQEYRLACTVTELAQGEPACQATVWHNRLFNPQAPAPSHVLAFQPDWSTARASPAP